MKEKDITLQENEIEVDSSMVEYIDSLTKECESWKKKYTYAIADFDNLKKRTAKDKEHGIEKGITDTVLAILPVLDDFERAFVHNELADGGKLIYKKFIVTLESFGVERILIDKDTEFDIDEHEAISKVGEGNKVVEEVLAGYKLNGKVIRYAKVIVG